MKLDGWGKKQFKDTIPPFKEPSDYYDTPINKVLHFIRGVGLIKV
jgi:hypothetical protein